jgi:hypothetical protein
MLGKQFSGKALAQHTQGSGFNPKHHKKEHHHQKRLHQI